MFSLCTVGMEGGGLPNTVYLSSLIGYNGIVNDAYLKLLVRWLL